MPDAPSIRFGDFAREISVHQLQVSANELIPPAPYRPTPVKLRPIDLHRLITPYLSRRLVEQVRAVVPLALYLLLFQTLVLHQSVTDAGSITLGLGVVILGLMLFMEGLKVGLMPFGEMLGTTLPAKATLHVVMLIAFLLGIGVTFAEPAIGALQAAGAMVREDQAPVLFALLNRWAGWLVLMVGIGVGIAAVLGTLLFLYGWSLKPLIYGTLFPTLALTAYMAGDHDLSQALGLAWDCGAITTGPVTVPLVLALGIGISTAAGRGSAAVSGFGIVTLASLLPVLAVQLLAITVAANGLGDGAATTAAAAPLAWYEQTPGLEIVSGLRAILPLVLFLLLVLRLVLKERLKHPLQIGYGIGLAVAGMILFNLGLSWGLSPLGQQAGGMVPAAFTAVPDVAYSPLYQFVLGLGIAVIFAWVLGFAATLAEPALNAMGMTVENLTSGAFRKGLLMYSVSCGVGSGIAVGLAKIIFEIPIAWLLFPIYLLALILTLVSREEFVAIAWDSAGVTTGPVTVPLVLALGLGFGNAMGAIEGFGILAMASAGPVVSVLSTALWIDWKVNRRHRAEERQLYQALKNEEAAG